jgi:hypothetical protein
MVLIAVILGPLIAGIALSAFFALALALFVTHSFAPMTISNASLGASKGALYAFYHSYYVGVPIALIAGLLVGLTWILWRAPNVVIVLSAAALATLIWNFVGWSGSLFDLMLALPAVLLAAAGCWVLSRRYVGHT